MLCRGFIVYDCEKMKQEWQIKFDIQHDIEWLLLEKKLNENIKQAINSNLRCFSMKSQYGPIQGFKFGQGVNQQGGVFLIMLSTIKIDEQKQRTLLCQIFSEVIENSLTFENNQQLLKINLQEKYQIIKLINEYQKKINANQNQKPIQQMSLSINDNESNI